MTGTPRAWKHEDQKKEKISLTKVYMYYHTNGVMIAPCTYRWLITGIVK